MNLLSSARIENLLSQMTLDEKLAEMTQLSPLFFGAWSSIDLTGPLKEMDVSQREIKNLGSTLNYFGAKDTKALQDKHLADSRLKIPLLFMADVIHGYQTVFPIPLALGCSFNPENYRIASSTAAKESAASGIHLTFSPMVDLVRDPRWGRVMESTGEDSYLNSLMAAAAVKGFQGDNPAEKGRVASCVKHFAGYGASEGGRDYNWVELSENSLRQYYLPSYKSAVDAGCKMVMTSFNVIDGVPASANKKLFRDILRDEWGFKGATISDYAAIDETITNGLAENGSEAARLCIEAGVDIEMMSTHYIHHGKQLVESGKLSVEQIDSSVRNILQLKEDLGLFENPYKDASEEDEKKLFLCAEHRAAARKVARECAVLLKNDGTLPLKKNLKVGVAGPYAHSGNTNGGWSIAGDKDSLSLAETIKTHGVPVVTAMSQGLGSMQEGIMDCADEIDAAVNALRDCDVIIAAVGESPLDTGEAASKTSLRLSCNQEKMIFALAELKKPMIVICLSGRPLEIKPILHRANAFLQAWFLGSESPGAIADILFGDYNPCGRLSMSFPQTVGQIPVYYNGYHTGRPNNDPTNRFVSRYLDCPNEPLFPFGYGLSYSDVVYSDFKATVSGDEIQASITVTNNSDINTREAVQLYVRDLFASVVRPVKELKGIALTTLAPHEKRTVHFVIGKDMLRFHNNKLEFVFEPGEFEIMIGKNSAELTGARLHFE